MERRGLLGYSEAWQAFSGCVCRSRQSDNIVLYCVTVLQWLVRSQPSQREGPGFHPQVGHVRFIEESRLRKEIRTLAVASVVGIVIL